MGTGRGGGRGQGLAPSEGPGQDWDWLRLYGDWIELGGEPGAFWRQTPRLYRAFVGAKARALQRLHDEFAFAAYFGGLFSQPMKSRPSFDSFLGRKASASAPARRQSWQEQKAIMSAWTAVIDADPRTPK